MAVGITDDVYKSIETYFNALSHFGYKKQSDVDKLIIYSFIEELLTGDLRGFISEEDYQYIGRALECLYGTSCLIPYPQYINNDVLFGHYYDGQLIIPRITEEQVTRFTEYDTLRIKVDN